MAVRTRNRRGEGARLRDDIVAAAVALLDETGVEADAVALWLGLHGLAHQKSVTVSFPWPADIAERLIVALAHLTGGRG